MKGNMEDNNNRFDEERLKSLRLEKRALGYLLKSPNKEQDYYDVAPLLTEKSFADKMQILNDNSSKIIFV